MVHACISYEKAKGISYNLLSQEAVRADHISPRLHHWQMKKPLPGQSKPLNHSSRADHIPLACITDKLKTHSLGEASHYLGGGGALDTGVSSASDSRLLNKARALAVLLLVRRAASCKTQNQHCLYTHNPLHKSWIQKNLSNPTATVLCWNRQVVRLHRVKNIAN